MIHAVILAGGRGTRFWPLSRRKRPKQLLTLGPSGISMLEETVHRAGTFAARDRIRLCTQSEIMDGLDFPVGSLKEGQVILEPCRRDTSAALALSSLYLQREDPEAIMVALNSDHHIEDLKGFRETINTSAEIAVEGRIVVIGVEPTHPATGYGYLQLGESLGDSAYQLKRFKEKPSKKTAIRYMKSGKYLWNSGIFVWRCDKFMQELEVHMPSLYKEISSIGKYIGTDCERRAVTRAYSRIDSVSIDYGFMEKAKGLVALKAGFDWDDLGSWTSLGTVKEADRDGNIVLGDRKVVLLDSKESVVVSEGPLVGVLGVEDVIVVATDDALLVAHKRDSQRVKELVREIEKRGLDEFL